MTRMQPEALDPRQQKSRAAILQAFFRLVLSERYHEISILQIVHAAGVARSTFYEHFKSKDELLQISLRGPFAPLATTVHEHADINRVVLALDHLWHNRAFAPALLHGAVGKRALGCLVELVECELNDLSPLRLPKAFVAAQIAGSIFASLNLWMAGKHGIGAQDYGDVLCRSTAALASAFRIA